MANRRKFIAGLGALATGSAAAMGTGAFSSVSASRGLEVEVSDDASALLSIDDIDGSENSEYVDASGDTVSINISSDEGGEGLNADATTKILDLLEIANQGTEDVYVWFEGVPDGVKFSVQNGDSTFKNNEAPADGADKNVGALSQNSNLTVPSDPSGGGTAGAEGAPLLGVGDNIVVELFSYGDVDSLDFDADITIKAVAQSEA